MDKQTLKNYAYHVRLCNTTKCESRNDLQNYFFEKKTMNILKGLEQQRIFDVNTFVSNILKVENLKDVYNQANTMLICGSVSQKDFKYLLPVDTFMEGLVEKYPDARQDCYDMKIACKFEKSMTEYSDTAIEVANKYEDKAYESFKEQNKNTFTSHSDHTEM